MSVTGNEALSRNNSTAMLSLVNAYDDEEEGGGEAVAGEEGGTLADDAAQSIDDQFSGSEDEQQTEPPRKRTPDVKRQDDDASSTPKKLRLERNMMKLVSYGDAVDEEGEEDEEESEDEGVNEAAIFSRQQNDDAATEDATTSSKDGLPNEDLLPPEPPGKCPSHIQKKVADMYERMRTRRVNLNQSIQRKKEFRNPSIYEKLIQFLGIDEKATNYPPELYDPSIWGPESYYTELARVQKEEMDKREKERKDKTKIEFVSGVKKDASMKSLVGGAVEQRKSKWDTQGAASRPGDVTTAALNVTTAASGNKTTVISAMGTLKKTKS